MKGGVKTPQLQRLRPYTRYELGVIALLGEIVKYHWMSILSF